MNKTPQSANPQPTYPFSHSPLPVNHLPPHTQLTTNHHLGLKAQQAASHDFVNLPGSRLHLVPRLNKSEKRHSCAVPCLRRLNGVSAWAFFRWLLALRMGGCMHCPAALGLVGSLTRQFLARVRARRCREVCTQRRLSVTLLSRWAGTMGYFGGQKALLEQCTAGGSRDRLA